MAETKSHTFIISDESILNSYNFRVLTAGIDTAHYKRNPIVMWFHKRASRWGDKNGKDEILPIGKVIKLWKEEGKLFGRVVFDQDDEFAVKVEKKLDGGFLNMCSPGLLPITLSDDTKYLLPGQTRSTVVKSRLEEISIVDRGSNDNALRLYNEEGGMIELSAEGENIIPKINLKNETMELKNQLAGLLNLSVEAADNTFVEKVKGLIADAGYKVKFETLSTEVEKASNAQIVALVEANVDKKFTADKKDMFIELGKSSGLASLQNLFATMADIQGRPGDGLKHRPAESADGEYKTFAELAAKGTDEIQKFIAENKEKYIALYKEEYGFAPSFAE